MKVYIADDKDKNKNTKWLIADYDDTKSRDSVAHPIYANEIEAITQACKDYLAKEDEENDKCNFVSLDQEGSKESR